MSCHFDSPGSSLCCQQVPVRDSCCLMARQGSVEGGEGQAWPAGTPAGACAQPCGTLCHQPMWQPHLQVPGLVLSCPLQLECLPTPSSEDNHFHGTTPAALLTASKTTATISSSPMEYFLGIRSHICYNKNKGQGKMALRSMLHCCWLQQQASC